MPAERRTSVCSSRYGCSDISSGYLQRFTLPLRESLKLVSLQSHFDSALNDSDSCGYSTSGSDNSFKRKRDLEARRRGKAMRNKCCFESDNRSVVEESILHFWMNIQRSIFSADSAKMGDPTK